MAISVLEFISGIPGQSEEYTTPMFQSRIGRLQTCTPAFDDFMWTFCNRRHRDCLATAQDVLFGHLLPGATGIPPPKTREYIKKMIAIMEHDTPTSKDRWIGHPSIPPRMFGPRQYLVTPPIQKTKPRVTSKPLPPSSSVSKLVPKET